MGDSLKWLALFSIFRGIWGCMKVIPVLFYITAPFNQSAFLHEP